jgi:hypothetical protein
MGTTSTRHRASESSRGDMLLTRGQDTLGGDNGHTGAVDEALAKARGGRPATWHSRRFGPHSANLLAASIIRAREVRTTGPGRRPGTGHGWAPGRHSDRLTA